MEDQWEEDIVPVLMQRMTLFSIPYILGELRKELKSKMRLKTASTHKEATYGEIQRHEEQIQSL